MKNQTEHCTIYLLLNTVNTKVYVGQTWRTTKKRFSYGSGYNNQPHLSAAIKLYGADKFYYQELMITFNQIDADYFEKLFIEQYNSNNREFGYNLSGGGSNGKHSTDTKKKLSILKKGKPGRKQSNETKLKISKSLTGLKRSDEAIKHMSEAKLGNKSVNYGKPMPEKTKQKISEKVSGENHPFFGKKHSEKSIVKIQKAHAILTIDDVIEIRRLYENKIISQVEIAKRFNVSTQNINSIVKRRSWKNI